jgi:hypothetical protein
MRRSSPTPRFPRWLATGLIIALILGGLTMIAVGLLRDGNQQQMTTSAPGGTAAQKPSNTPSATTPQPVPKRPQQQRQGKQATSAPQSAPAGAAGAQLQSRRIADRFTIGIPPGWERGTKDGAITFTAPGATAEIDVFFESGSQPTQQLARAVDGFLANRHPGAQVGAPQPLRLGALRALRVQATYSGGEEVAVVVSAKGYSYLLLRRVDRGAAADLRGQADAALASFRPA